MNKIIGQSICPDFFLFREHCTGARELVQDTIFHISSSSHLKNKKNDSFKKNLEQEIHTYFLSNFVNAVNFSTNPICYLRNGVSQNKLKNLKKGKYRPDIFVDLHGLNKKQAILELSTLIFTCKKEHLFCANIIHGHGKNILKNNIPIWLSHHPDVLAFYQDSVYQNKSTSIIVLIEL
ncbi:endonuclease SmrB [Buchnera aphidicola (Thelaxes californica)]|uniref:Endonuclease SmrB n=1 Tax=Buchnera aphidicola (Thelaxes californica) TaxID=1315998 RepID=A0A4D6Y9G2_9GAMM|nr:endonuclease SmrB [Buchnera aphidicola]QCI26636.1 endonuclease SmrB [Buchnera aphidicola (Thelaxes californica)]